jgi:hypothetical protein
MFVNSILFDLSFTHGETLKSYENIPLVLQTQFQGGQSSGFFSIQVHMFKINAFGGYSLASTCIWPSFCLSLVLFNCSNCSS